MEKLPVFKQAQHAGQAVKQGPCLEVILTGDAVDLTRLPIQHCWPGDVGPHCWTGD